MEEVRVDIKEIVKSLEGYRTIVLYDSVTPTIPIIKTLIEMYKEGYIVIFSNSAFRKFRIISNIAGIDTSNLKMVVMNETGRCGDAYACFSYEDLDDFVAFASKLEGLIVLWGHWTLKRIVKEDRYWRLAFDVFDALHPKAWGFSFAPKHTYTPYERSLLSMLYDVTAIVKKVGEPYMFGEEVYSLEIFESVLKEVLPGTVYFMIDKDYSFIPR